MRTPIIKVTPRFSADDFAICKPHGAIRNLRSLTNARFNRYVIGRLTSTQRLRASERV